MDFKIEPLPKPNIPAPEPQPLKRSVFDLIKPFTNFLKTFVKTKYIALGLAVLLLVALTFFFMGRGSFHEGDVELKIEGSTEVTGGDLVTYKITYKNKNKIDLSDAKLNILYPQDSVVVKDGNIVDLNAENFDIDEIGNGEAGEKEFSAYIVGDRGSVRTLKATLTYRAGNLSSTFRKEMNLATTITSLAVPITLVATPTIISGQNTSYLIDYRNQSSQDLENLRFVIKYPQGFAPTKFSPEPTVRSANQASWDVVKLKQGDGSRITIEGKLSGGEREAKVVSATLQKKITTPNGDIYVDFEKAEASSVISTPALSLDLRLNDSDDYVAHLGDSLRYRLKFQNNNGENITGLSLSVKLAGNMYDFTTVRSEGFFDSRLNTIFWNASTVSALNILSANQSGIVEFEVRLKGSFTGGLGAKDSFVKASAHMETSNVPNSLDLDKLATDDELITRISTAPTFDQKILTADSVFSASGPYPPKVNQKTALTVHWNLVNPSNDVSSAKVTATLAPGIVWENKVRSSGTLIQPSYDSRLNTITWDLGTLPGGIGIVFPLYETFFQISITPSVNQVNQSPQLIKNVRFDGVDSFTKEKITRTIFDMTTSNASDTSGAGNVQP
ncbi:MAG: hypothetical protein A2831_02810 [Candidatus Yanofskybacteria bacterium RIFCSPHIGHO2_01_FULL_44_17]|uniref:DUF11 domain-containing protein n=1 Tax=Candidatus Yanofskybacteria bacterium RIFCSPHIGHO2_01_FULL_44_17 TaxID=1802668 RepID=A0A1F8EUD6_9BACT|nr:MAG: hypothetical protein A2831_02810 [Candidatus Yanofskybacteria bacterium RIFCSPHIGHO2_01_FULL_44_17]